MTRPAVFLDRDGTVTEEVGYVNHLDRLKLLPGVGPAVRRLNEADVPAVLITNQAGVARGYFPIDLVYQTHRKLTDMLAAEGARLNGVYFSPFVKEGSEAPYNIDHPWRKPGTGMLEQAARDLRINLISSFMIGDKITDVELARRVGARGVYVLTGYGKGELAYRRHLWSTEPDFIGADLMEAVAWILGEIKR